MASAIRLSNYINVNHHDYKVAGYLPLSKHQRNLGIRLTVSFRFEYMMLQYKHNNED